MYAIKPFGIGKPVGARAIADGWPLEEGEAFTVEHWAPDMVLAADGKSLRKATPAELTEIAASHPARARQLELAGIEFAERPKTLAEKLAAIGVTEQELLELLKRGGA